MSDQTERLKILFDRYQLSEPVSPEQQEYIIKQRKSDLKKLLKKTGGYGSIFWLSVLIYDSLRKFGIHATLVQSKILLGIMAAAIASGASTGAYVGVKYIVNIMSGQQIMIDEKINTGGEGPIDSDTHTSVQDKLPDRNKSDDTPVPETVTIRKTSDKSTKRKNDAIEDKKHKSELESKPSSEVPTL
jgi:hypothetical protein